MRPQYDRVTEPGAGIFAAALPVPLFRAWWQAAQLTVIALFAAGDQIGLRQTLCGSSAAAASFFFWSPSRLRVIVLGFHLDDDRHEPVILAARSLARWPRYVPHLPALKNHESRTKPGDRICLTPNAGTHHEWMTSAGGDQHAHLGIDGGDYQRIVVLRAGHVRP